MRVSRPTRVFVVATVVMVGAAPMGVFAQGPVAVPIVGSPAAQQQQQSQPPSQPPQTPPNVPQRPPSAPPVAPAGAAPAAVASAPAAPAAQYAAPVASGARKLELSFKDGSVTLDAQNVTIREILHEWQQKDGCQFVNLDKLPGAPVSLQFPAGTPALQAIESLLRGLGTPTTGYGYIVAPAAAQSPSVCGAVMILASSRPTTSASFMPSSSPVAAPIMSGGSPDDEIPPVTPFAPVPPAQPRPIVPGMNPNQPGQPIQYPNPNAQPGSNNAPPAVQSPGFGPIAPTAPGAGTFGAPAPAPAPNTGRGRGGGGAF